MYQIYKLELRPKRTSTAFERANVFHLQEVNRDLKGDVYGKRLTSYIKTKSLAVKCFTYKIYSRDRKPRTETLCLTTETENWRLILNDFSVYIAWRFTCAVWCFKTFYNGTARQLSQSGSLQASNVNSNVKRMIPQIVSHQWCFGGHTRCLS